MRIYSKKALKLQKPETESQILFKHRFARIIYLIASVGIILPTIATHLLIGSCVIYLYSKLVSKTMPLGFKVWLPTEKCCEALILCEEHEELDSYRKKVVNLNRRFTIQEFEMLKKYADAKEYLKKIDHLTEAHKSSCRRLYLANE